MPKLDYKKDYKELYLPKASPFVVDVPPMRFIMVDGAGDLQGDEYQHAVSLLYTLSYTIKMKGKELDGYMDYVVFPLEGLWWCEGGLLVVSFISAYAPLVDSLKAEPESIGRLKTALLGYFQDAA